MLFKIETRRSQERNRCITSKTRNEGRANMRKRLLFAPLVLLLASGLGLAKTNAEIVAAIQDHLYHAQVFKHGNVQVAYGNGVATLTGTVDNLGLKLDAERATRKVEDVSQVVDNLKVHAEDVTTNQILEQA